MSKWSRSAWIVGPSFEVKVNDGPRQGDVLGERKKNFLSFFGRVACQTLVGDFYLTRPGYLPFAMHYKVEIGRTKDTIVVLITSLSC